MKRLFYSVLLLFIGITLNLQAQVVIGDAVAPQSFSALEIISNGTGGLRLPQLTNAQRAAVQTAIEALAPAEQYKALGLMIFNLETNCVETWNGTEWKRNCASADLGSIGSLDCSGAAITTISGAAVNVNKTLTYSDLTGIVSVTDGQELGTEGSLTVIANGAQELTDPTGTINIKITGTAPAAGTSIPVALAGADCNISVTISDPESIPTGAGSLLGRTCFDLALSNSNTTCGLIASRLSQQADFNQPATNTQTYTFVPTGTVSDIRFYFVETNGEGLIVTSFTADGDYSGDATAGNSYTATLVYKSGLNSSAYGLTSANALTVDIYAIYNNAAVGNNGTDRTVKLTASIKDCACCGAPTNTGGWLTLMCHNLGANESADPYSWTHNSANDANGSIDIKGDLYQWGRPKDGHEKRNSATTSTLANSNTPGHANFIVPSSKPTDWRNGSGQLSRWGNGTDNLNMPKAANDPCPAGWKVPSQKQWISIYTARESGANSTLQSDGTMSWLWTGNGYKIGNNLFLPAAGHRSPFSASPNAPSSVGTTGIYWSSAIRWETNEYMALCVYFTGTLVWDTREHPAAGNSVRCTPE
jgi:Fibrobacter succinogenes major domain (Fib_succ_major).